MRPNRKRAILAAAIACTGLAAAAAPAAAAPRRTMPSDPAVASFRTVDVPGAYGTEVNALNDHGTLVGTYFTDQGAENFGFIEQGTQLTTLNYPNTSGVTWAAGINDRGYVVGIYNDAGGSGHGWMRTPDGTFTQIDDPLAANGPGLGTSPSTINNAGVIVGYYFDSSGAAHGYIDDDGTFKTIDAPGAGTMADQGTALTDITDNGLILGFYIDPNGVSHGFIYTSGRFIDFNAPGAGTSAGQGTYPAGIGQNGVIAGTDENASGYAGWELANGRFLNLDDPNAGTGSLNSQPLGTYIFDLDPSGDAVSGAYWDSDGVEHGFVAALSH